MISVMDGSWVFTPCNRGCQVCHNFNGTHTGCCDGDICGDGTIALNDGTVARRQKLEENNKPRVEYQPAQEEQVEDEQYQQEHS